MDKKINAYFESLVSKALSLPMFSNMPLEQKEAKAEKIRNYLDDIVIDTVLENLNLEQLNDIKSLAVNSSEMESKITEYSSTIPNFAGILENKLNQAVAAIEQNPQVVE
ncbi:hypothetical protein M1437_01110 [Patescibacteria group bacterium]|nr:hypothetical protein [Patescibacteria group bacterium]